MGESAQPAIDCRGLWQVFGEQVDKKLSSALQSAEGDTGQAAEALCSTGCVPAVIDVSFQVESGELFVIMGLSGSGKSTLIRSISRLIEPTAGSIAIDGEDILGASRRRLITLRRQKLGMVFQHFGLFPHMNVLQNVSFPLKMQGQPKRQCRARAQEVIDLVGLEGLEASYPRQLSGGQRQRVGIARSLAVNPDVWFLDEPFSALDPLIRRQLQDEFLRLQRSLAKSIVFITHDISEALKLADRIAILRGGRIVQIGTPAEIVLHPVDSYVREFTTDVAKGRHARVQSMMSADTAVLRSTASDPKLRIDMTLDMALASCVSLYEPVPVWDHEDRIVGAVHPRDLAAALRVDEP